MNNKMDKLNDYLKNECEINEPQLENLSEHEIGLLIKATINLYIEHLLNDTFPSYFFNLLGLIMESKKKYGKAKKFYLMAIKKDNISAMKNLGFYYGNIKKNYDEAEKYYLMAIERGDSSAMNNLGFNYDNVKKNYNKAEKYYLMAIGKGDITAYRNFKSAIVKYGAYKSFINCNVDLIKNGNFTFVNKFNKFVNQHFNKCLKYISKNAAVLHKHLYILNSVNFTNKNYCMNCNKYTLLTKSNCKHNICLACNNLQKKNV